MIMLDTSPYLGHLATTETVVWGICVGAILAFAAYFVQMHVLGSLVRALMGCAVGECNAKTLDELGKNKVFYRHSLRDNSNLRRIVSVEGGSVPKDSDGASDFGSARFYIEEEKLKLATDRYEKDTRPIMLIIGVAACLAVGIVMHFLLPVLLNLLP